MPQQDNEAVIRTYLRAWETGSTALFDEVLAPDFVDSMFGKSRTRGMLLQQATSGDVSRPSDGRSPSRMLSASQTPSSCVRRRA